MKSATARAREMSEKIDVVDLLIKTYTCKEDVLKYKLRKINNKLREIREHYDKAIESINKMLSIFQHYVSYIEYGKLVDAKEDLEEAFMDAIDKLVYYEIPYDADVEKFEKVFNVKFTYETERLLGVILVEDKGTVRPVAIWTDYNEVGYIEGEKSE
jgi:hypothetical protein